MPDEETSTLAETTEPGEPGESATGPRRKRRLLLLGIPVVLVALAGAGVWWFFFRDDSPPAPTIETAREGLDDSQAEEGGPAEDGSATDEIEGTWVVDPSIGSFDDFTSTYAGYRIQEQLASVGASEAVGRTLDVTGSVTIEGDQVVTADFEVDMTTLQSDESFRDNRLKGSGLETDTFGTASFSLTEPLDLPEDAASGDELSYEAVGELELHGVTREITVTLDAALEDEAIVIVASAPIVLADHDIEKPSAPTVVSIEDEGSFELQVFLSR